MKSLEACARYWLVKITLTNQNRADMIWTQHGSNTTTRRQTCIVNGHKTVKVASNGVTMRGDIVPQSLAGDYRFQGAGTPRKKVARPSRVCRTHSEEPRAAKRPEWYSAPEWNRVCIHLAILWREILPIAIEHLECVKTFNVVHD